MFINLQTCKRIISTAATVILLVLVISPYFAPGAQARSAKEIDVSVDVALNRFSNEVPGAQEFLKNSKVPLFRFYCSLTKKAQSF